MLHVSSRPFGTALGRQATEYTLENARGAQLSVTDYGARITHLLLPDRDGGETDVVLGYDSAADYAAGDEYFGATCGRYANRLAGAEFALNGTAYRLDANENGNILHGGTDGFHNRFFTVTEEEDAICCTLESPAGDMGFPAALTLTVRFTLTEDDTVRIRYEAVSDGDTVVNVTNHSYFNLDGGGSVLSHSLAVHADFYTPTDAQLLPTGEIRSVIGTGFDLRTPTRLSERIDPVHPDLAATNGIDHNFVLNKRERDALTLAAVLTSRDGSRVMECHTTLPGLQVYTANVLNTRTGRGGKPYAPHSAVCLETQVFPNAMQRTHFPSPILRKGEAYRSVTEYRFFDR